MIPHQLVWLIFLLPLFSFVIIAFLVRPFIRAESKVAGYIAIAAIGGSLALSVWALLAVTAAPHHEIPVPDINWVVIGDGVTIHLGLIMDSLTAVMLIVATSVSLMVQIYSQGYMQGDPGYHRYYAWMSLFTASMIGLVLADNLLFMFVFWELVGLCSYLLIGFWFHKPSAANAAKKAFIVTRIGDFGFLAGILILYFNTGTFDILELHELAIAGALAGTTLTWAAIGIFAGAVGKSAQFPLHVWLPDAMDGRRRGIPGGPHVPPLRALHPSPDHSGRHRRGHRHLRRLDGAGDERYQARSGVLHHQPARLHDAGVGRRRGGHRHLPPLQPRFLQGAALPRFRQRQPCHRHL
jgi:NADH-quinone oxidoreductase subunit L